MSDAFGERFVAQAREASKTLRLALPKGEKIRKPTFEEVEASLTDALNGEYVLCRVLDNVVAITPSGKIIGLDALTLSDSDPIVALADAGDSDSVSLKFETADRNTQYTIKRYTKANRFNYIPDFYGKNGLFPTADCFDKGGEFIFTRMSLENLEKAEKRFEERRRKDNLVDIAVRYNPEGLDDTIRRGDDTTTKVHMIRDGNWLDWFAIGRNSDRGTNSTKLYNELDFFVKRCDDGKYVSRIRPDLRSGIDESKYSMPRHDIKMKSDSGMCDVFEIDPVDIRTMRRCDRGSPNYEKTFHGLFSMLFGSYSLSMMDGDEYKSFIKDDSCKVPFSRGIAATKLLDYKCAKSCDTCGDCAVLKVLNNL